VQGIDRDGEVVVRRRLRRSRVLPSFATVEPCRIGIEVCAGGHHWERELRALGHDVRLMAPSYMKPYVKRQKNDAAHAEAICEAVGWPTMRFVPVKTAEQQSVMVLHRTRLLLMRQRIRSAEGIRASGVCAPRQQAGHMAAPTSLAARPRTPCQRRAVHTWLPLRFRACPEHDRNTVSRTPQPGRCCTTVHEHGDIVGRDAAGRPIVQLAVDD
jgi:transposase